MKSNDIGIILLKHSRRLRYNNENCRKRLQVGDKITMSTFVQEQRLYYSPTKATCTTWGSEHFKTFDNFIFDFASTCNYIFVSDCSGNLGGFNIQIRRGKHGNIKRISMNIWGTSIIIENANTIVNDNGFVQLPYNLNGIQIKSFGGSTRLVAKQKGFDLVVVWNFIDYIMVELGDEYRNKTCGLCGDFNGHPQLNEFKQGGKVLSPQKFANQYQVDDPSETCHPLDVTNLAESYVDYVSDCSCMLNKVAPLCKLPKKIYVSECQRDLYKCTAKGDTRCSCQTLSEYSRQCSRLLQPVMNWRNISFCPPIPCPGNQVYQECGSPCLSTCSNPQTTCDSYGTYGCFCPEGTVLDDIATKDTCIPLSRCPCVLNGQVYAPGGSVNSPCKSCKCVMGKWDCTNLPCPGRCSIEGGSFVTTFDSRRYRFHGVCTYLLIKSWAPPSGRAWSLQVVLPASTSFYHNVELDQLKLHKSVKMLDSGTIEAVFDKCGVRHSETQLTGIIYATNQTKIIISKQDTIEVNNKIMKLPYQNENIKIYRQSSSYIQVKSSFGLEMQIQTHPFLQLYIIVDENFATTTHGLCGNFDGNSQNDFKSSMGIQEGTASSFVDSWRVIEHCQSAQDIDSHPCSLSQSNSVFAESYCSILMNKSSIFGQCHCRVDPTDYYERCKFETCNYEKSQDFMCNSLGVYARACAIKGLILINWRNVVNECKISCHGHQVFSYDSKACNRTCFSLSNSMFECTESGVPVEGCNCPPDTFLDNTNTCVKASSCPCFLQDGAIIPAGKSINIFEQLCLCNNGKVECSGNYFAPEELCDHPKIYFDCANGKNGEYGAAYLPTCQMHATETRCVQIAKNNTAQPCDQGILHSMKSKYKDYFLNSMLAAVNREVEIQDFLKEFGLKDTIYVIANAWDDVDKATLTSAWHKLWPTSMFLVNTPADEEFEGFHVTEEKKMIASLVTYCAKFIGRKCKCEDSSDDELVNTVGKGFIEDMVKLCDQLIAGFEQHSFIRDTPLDPKTAKFRFPQSSWWSRAFRIKGYVPDSLIKLTNGHYQITPPNTARGLKVISNPLYLKFDLKISSMLELTIIWNRNMNAYISITRLSEFAVCGLCGNYNGNADDEYITQNKYLVSNVLTFANSWKEDPTCRDVTEVVFPCHKNPYRLARAEKMCAIINNKVFEPCHKLVYRMPYYDNCVRDACGCELAGDCECLCDAVAVYAKACIDAGVCIDWRTPDFCPVYCDYFNYHKGYSIVGESSWNTTNRWHYQPCLCPANIHIFGKFNMEGCYICGKYEYFHEELRHCVPCVLESAMKHFSVINLPSPYTIL
ncbi:mucin-6-like [Chiloscyllium punctatum]|uniref:mucin-6-like n=1 Tax=Chiloscyllium punctatum TaxID=137246 RepID=UPI003B63207F